jgi:membrane protein
VPTYSLIYGAFATLPILLVWIYVAWVVVLLGAVIAAYLPSLLAGVQRRGGTPGWRFQLAIEAIAALDAARATPAKGLDMGDLARHLKVDGLQLEPVIDTLLAMDWVGQLEDGRDVLLVDLEKTSAAPLVNALLLAEASSVENFMKNSQIPTLSGRQLLHIMERSGP